MNMDKTLHQHSDTIIYVIADMSSEIFRKINVVIGLYVYTNVHESNAVNPSYILHKQWK